jgi:hypothetical protein
MAAPNDLREAYTGQKRGLQAGFASCLSNSASKCLAADGVGLAMPEPNTDRAVAGEALEGLPGSKSVARAAAAARNQGGPKMVMQPRWGWNGFGRLIQGSCWADGWNPVGVRL